MSKFIYKIIVSINILLITTTTALQAQAPEPIEPPKVLSTEEVIAKYANLYKVSYIEMYKTMKCESSLNPNAINSTTREYSVGISQINLMAHKHITVEQAKDVEFASEFMAKEFAKGNKRIWTCYVKIFGV